MEVWTVECVAGFLLGAISTAMKSRRLKVGLFSRPGRKVLAGFAPPVLAGAVLTIVFHGMGMHWVLPGIWLLLYGAGVVSGGGNSVRVVPLMGVCFMAVGAVALLGGEMPGNILLAVGFGGLHIVFGTIIAVKYGG
jgi:hypothetical protein